MTVAMGDFAENTIVVGPVGTPIGTFGAALSPAGLGRLTFATESLGECGAWARRWMPEARVVHDSGPLTRLSEELTAYFEGALREFTVPVDLRGTEFQVSVWRALLGIGYGVVRSYASVATQIGRPRAVRAVGAANGANPVPILVPCHRVIGSSGTLTGYGGGLTLKEQLLRLEGGLASAGSSSRRGSRGAA